MESSTPSFERKMWIRMISFCGHPLHSPLIGDVGNAQGLDHIHHLLALVDQNVRFPQFAEDLFETGSLLRHAGLLFESV